jgi:hypothetical protein
MPASRRTPDHRVRPSLARPHAPALERKSPRNNQLRGDAGVLGRVGRFTR